MHHPAQLTPSMSLLLEFDISTNNPDALLLPHSFSNTSAISPCDPVCTQEEGAESITHKNMEDGSYFRWTKVVIASLITLVIICSNTVNLVALYQMREIGVRMKVLLLSLSTSDICLGFFVCMPGVVSGILTYWPFGRVMCQITGLMNGVAISVSLWSLMAIGVERFLVMKRPNVSKAKKNPFVVSLCVAFIWTFNTLFFALPILGEPGHLYYKYDPDVLTCSFMWKHTWHFLMAKFLYPMLSGTVIVFTSCQVNQVLKKAERARKQWIISSDAKAKQKKNNQNRAVTPQQPHKKLSDSSKDSCKTPCTLSSHNSAVPFQVENAFSQGNKCTSKNQNNQSDQGLPQPPIEDYNFAFTLTNAVNNTDPKPQKSIESDKNLNGNWITHVTESSTDETVWAGFVTSSNSANGQICESYRPKNLSNSSKATSDNDILRSPLSGKDLNFHFESSSSNPSDKITISDPSEQIPKHSCEAALDPGNNELHSKLTPSSKVKNMNNSNKDMIHCNEKCQHFSSMIKRARKKGTKDSPFKDTVHTELRSATPKENTVNQFPTPMSKSFLQRQSKAKALLLCTTTVFFIAISPYMISSTLEHFIPGLVLPPWLKFLAFWTLSTNSLINVFIYSAVYAEFRGHCKRLWQGFTCRAYREREPTPSGPTSSLYELFAVKSKATSCSKAPSSGLGSCDNDDTFHGDSGKRDSCSNTLTSTASTFSGMNTFTESEFCKSSVLCAPENSCNYLQIPPFTHSSRQPWQKCSGGKMPGVLQVLPNSSQQRKLQPRDDVGMFPAASSTTFSIAGVPVPTSTCSSVGVSPSISQSTSCSMDSFQVDMMPSVDV
ncbi:cholecystokinin receptor [Plakobranchus ocellatus]|uniref:Cholecystokinin receptor n=1 Tax=Plakobranchus ocellatus TaxID=259542 RepID=A0AAV4AFZ9_9GAST|nr:cholecystokinin receptor [Plakobranchus ocellatus]